MTQGARLGGQSQDYYLDNQKNERQLRSSSAWKRKSIEIRQRANFLCEVCKDNAVIEYRNIEVHHIDKVTDNTDRLLDNYNLIALCQPHHKAADAGKIDKEYLRKLARGREDGTNEKI